MRTTNERAILYHRSRPPYAAQIVGFIQEITGRQRFPVVADIGSGTGLSSKLFSACADQVIGVEPNDSMRGAAQPELSITFVEGRAEETGLPDACVDLLVAASCLEWCHPVGAVIEFGRVLSSTGFVVALWNHRRVTDPASWEFDQLWHRHMGPRLGPDDGDLDIIARRFLQPAPRTFRIMQHVPFDLVRLNDFALSSSYAPRPHQTRQLSALGDALEGFFHAHQSDGLTLPFETVCYVGKVRQDDHTSIHGLAHL